MSEVQATPKITVRLTLFADLKRFQPKGQPGPLAYELDPVATVASLLAAAHIPATEEITIGLNGNQGQRESPLEDGDEVVLFSPMEGG
jgi:molybdopterin converting factor small subunit